MAASSCKPSGGRNIAVRTGEAIAFLGDSNTAAGWKEPYGYVRRVMAALKANGVEAKAIPEGAGGRNSAELLDLFRRDVLPKKAQWVVVSAGTNDLWQTRVGQPAEKGTYAGNIRAIIEEGRAAGLRTVLATIPPEYDSLHDPVNVRIAAYNSVLRQLAAGEKLPLADVNALLLTHFAEQPRPEAAALTFDGIHLTAEGHRLFAIAVLRSLGLTAEQIGGADAPPAAE